MVDGVHSYFELSGRQLEPEPGTLIDRPFAIRPAILTRLSMGASAVTEPGQHLLAPNTPPELVSPGASTSFSSRSSPPTEPAWIASKPLASPPMSDYGKGSKAAMSVEKSAEGAALTKGSTASTEQPASRQQLPSLSSLFGPPNSRSLNSPMSERTSLPTASPMDRPRFGSSHARGHGDSYFPPALSPPISQPRSSYELAKYESERHSLHSLRKSTSGPASPGFRAHNHVRVESRADVEPHHSRWPTSHRQEHGKGDYSLESREAELRSRDFHLQFPGSNEAHHNYHDHRSSTASQNQPQTPTGDSHMEIITGKDGLGPKIWTGSHFLPRFVRAAEVPGEGLCYFYDDGSHCKTVIDGEAVNAHWGVTKAGKPRKRLAIACVTCREKKIKCDPDFPRCVQCEKFGRVCKFKNAPRGGHNGSPTTPPAEFEDRRKMIEPARPQEYRMPMSSESSPVSPRNTLPDHSSHKRIKVDHHTYVPNGVPSPAMSRPMDHSKSHVGAPLPPPEMPRIPESVLERAWQTNPYATDAHSISGVVDQFFQHIDSTMILQLLPERATKAWVCSPVHRKSPEDLMLLYSILAVGVVLSGGPKKHIAYEYAQVAHYAQRACPRTCLQLVQSRILLAVYYLSVMRHGEAGQMISAAAGTATCLQLNLELEQTREASLHAYPLNMTRAGYSESRRRAMWSLFMLERVNSMYLGRLTTINPENIYLRLPSDLRNFEEQLDSRSPMFNPHDLSITRSIDQPQEVASYLVSVVHIWAECQSSVYNLTHRPESSEAEFSRTRHLASKLEHWQAVIPSRLVSMPSNLETAAAYGQLGSFLTMHLLYHHASMTLNRYTRASRSLSAEVKREHVSKCRYHATETMELLERLDRLVRARPMALSVVPPMIALSVVEAVDVLSASRPLSAVNAVLDNIRVVKPLVDSMCGIWEESREFRYTLDKRLQMLNRIRDHASYSPSAIEGFRIVSKYDEKEGKCYHWEIVEPLERTHAREMDIVYGS